MPRGVSSIHSAVACVDAYGTVWDHDCRVVLSRRTMVHTFDPGTASVMAAWSRSPGWIVSDEMVVLGAGTSSHHAVYAAFPLLATSCSEPSWMSVGSVAEQLLSIQPPPIPIHVEDCSACPLWCWVGLGTVQFPATLVNRV